MRKKIIILTAIFVLTASCAAVQEKLQIYLPREIVIKEDIIKLESVCIMRGDESVIEKISDTSLGKFSVPGQQIILDRPSILSRIASQGVKTDNIEITGSEKVIVGRNEDIIDAGQIITIAEQFVKTLPQSANAHKINIIKKPKPWVITRQIKGKIELKPRLNRYQVSGITRLFIDILLDGKVVGTRDLSFDIRYKKQVAVAKKDIKSGETFSPLNIAIETQQDSPSPQPDGWLPPYGQVATVDIEKGKEITTGKSAPLLLPVSIKRRQMVLIKLETPLLTVTSIGEAMMDGTTGEFIKVKVGSGRDAREINARIKSDGTLEPFYEGMKI